MRAAILATALLWAPVLRAAEPKEPGPRAQEAIEAGVEAARGKDYAAALRHFEEARKLAPQSPLVYLNLGLAESKMAGRESRALAWLGAYLGAYPEAHNTAAVKRGMKDLRARGKARLLALAKAAHGAEGVMGGQNPADSLFFRAKLESGDLKGALAFSKSMGDHAERCTAQLAVAKARLPSSKAQALQALELARKSAAQVNSDAGRGAALAQIGALQWAAGSKSAAKSSFAAAAAAAALVGNSYNGGGETLLKIAAAQNEAGDKSGALATLAKARKAAETVTDSYQLEKAIGGLVAAYAQCGALREAKSVARQLKDSGTKYEIMGTIAAAQARQGDLKGALATADSMEQIFQRCMVRFAVAGAQFSKGDRKGGLDTVAGARKANDVDELASNRAFILVEAAKALTQGGEYAAADDALDEADGEIKRIPWNKATSRESAGSNRAWVKYRADEAGKALDALEHPRLAWLAQLDGPLNERLFTDWDDQLRSLKNSSPREYADGIVKTCADMAKEQDELDRLAAASMPPGHGK